MIQIKNIIIFTMILSVVLLVFFLGNTDLTSLNKNLNNDIHYQTEYVSGVFSVDYDDINQIVVDADYIFVGVINEYIGTSNNPEDGLPRSSYNVSIISNLKGNLAEKVIVYKHGGYDYFNKQIVLFQANERLDSIPTVNNKYIFISYTLFDGEMILMPIVGNTKYDKVLDLEYQKAIKRNKNIVAVEDLQDWDTKNKPQSRERFISKYDVSFFNLN